MRNGSSTSKEQARREEAATAESLEMTVDEFRAKYAPWRRNLGGHDLPTVHGRRKPISVSVLRGATRIVKASPSQPLRLRIFERDHGRCRYCGHEVGADQRGHRMFTLDHVIPRSRGGSNTESNLVTACYLCNHVKGDRTVEEAGMKLIPLD